MIEIFINKLHLENFRNYEFLDVDFDSQMNIIYGNNAQGKTNILESIYLCATSKSHRTSSTKELIRFEEDQAHITLSIQNEMNEDIIDVHLKDNNKKIISVNKENIKKMNELFGTVKIVFFSPEDLGLIKNGPKERRKFIDLELCQINPLYYYHLKSYYQVLKQRNNLLKLIKKDQSLMDQLDVWDIQLIQYGLKVIEYREKFIEELKPFFKKHHFDISGQKEVIDLIYEKNVIQEDFERKLQRNVKSDLLLGSTTVGPHKDDLCFLINQVDIRKYGSQGQQRTAALSLKLSEIDIIRNIADEKPILLLDDVLSELDQFRQNYIISNINDIQTLITCTGLEDSLRNNKRIGKLIHIENGRLK